MKFAAPVVVALFALAGRFIFGPTPPVDEPRIESLVIVDADDNGSGGLARVLVESEGAGGAWELQFSPSRYGPWGSSHYQRGPLNGWVETDLVGSPDYVGLRARVASGRWWSTSFHRDETDPVIESFTVAGYDSTGEDSAYKVGVTGSASEPVTWALRAGVTYFAMIADVPETLAVGTRTLADSLDTGIPPYNGILYVGVAVVDTSGNIGQPAVRQLEVARAETAEPPAEPLTVESFAIGSPDSANGCAYVVVSAEADGAPWAMEYAWKMNYDGGWSSNVGMSATDTLVSIGVTASDLDYWSDADSLYVRLRGRYIGDEDWSDYAYDVIDYDRQPVEEEPGEGPHISQIVGTFADGQIVTIIGTGFGEKVPAAPLIYDNFDDDGVEADVTTFLDNDATIGVWSSVGTQTLGIPPNQLLYSAASLDGSLCIKNLGQWDGYGGQAGCQMNSAPDHYITKGFLSIHIKWNVSDNDFSADGSKFLRLTNWSGSNAYGAKPMHRFALEEDGVSGLSCIVSSDYWVNTSYDNVGPDEFNSPNNQWFSASLWGRRSDPLGATNGLTGREFNGNIYQTDDILTTDEIVHDTQTYAYQNLCFINQYNMHSEGTVQVWFDEAYGDTFLARVSASDASLAGVSGDDGGQSYMQIPVTWSDSAVEVLVNTGHYEPGTIMTIYLWDDLSRKSNGVHVTVQE